MPTINEVWEQALLINANLATVHNDLTDLETCCVATNNSLTNLIGRVDETNDWMEELRNIINNGLTTIATGISGIHTRQDVTNNLLLLQVKQNQAIICILENISRNTCHLLNESAQQTELQENMSESLEAINHMYASSNTDASLIYSRHKEDRRLLEECCPPKPREPRCTYEVCPAPDVVEIDQPERYRGYVIQPSTVIRRRG